MFRAHARSGRGGRADLPACVSLLAAAGHAGRAHAAGGRSTCARSGRPACAPRRGGGAGVSARAARPAPARAGRARRGTGRDRPVRRRCGVAAAGWPRRAAGTIVELAVSGGRAAARRESGRRCMAERSRSRAGSRRLKSGLSRSSRQPAPSRSPRVVAQAPARRRDPGGARGGADHAPTSASRPRRVLVQAAGARSRFGKEVTDVEVREALAPRSPSISSLSRRPLPAPRRGSGRRWCWSAASTAPARPRPSASSPIRRRAPGSRWCWPPATRSGRPRSSSSRSGASAPACR